MRIPIVSIAAAVMLAAGCSSPPRVPVVQPHAETPAVPSPSSKSYAYVVISVADMDQALGLWLNRFGMALVARRTGTDPALARIWGLQSDEIIDQALLRTPGVSEGGVHLVRFKLPGPAVRADAATTDLVPKSVDIAVTDIQKRYDELSAAGYKFRSPVGTLTTGDVTVYEVHMPAQDGLNLVFVEQPAHPEPVSEQGFGVAPQIVMISPDNIKERDFFEKLMGLQQTSYNRFAGPQIEKTIGLPPGAGLDIRIMGDPAQPFGRLEIVQYEGVQSRNLYPRAKPPARGMLSVSYFVPSIADLATRAKSMGAGGASFVEHGQVSSLLGVGKMASVSSPAGLRIDFLEQPLAK